MSIENVKKLYEAVSQDESLKQKFVELSRQYQGHQMDEAKAKQRMEQEVLPIAEQMGYSFTMDDLKAYSEEMKQPDISRELSDEELHAVSGGGSTDTYNGFCIVIGHVTLTHTWDGDWGSGSKQSEWDMIGFCVGPGTNTGGIW